MLWKIPDQSIKLTGKAIPYQKILIELKSRRELRHDLMDSIQPLEEDRTLLVLVLLRAMTATVRKFVSKFQPFALDKHVETLLLEKKIKIILL